MNLAARLSLCLVFLTFPFYLAPSGEVQMSTGFMLLTLVLLVASGPSNIVITRQMFAHMAFVGWALAVNVTWYLLTDHPEFITYALFTAFVGVSFFTVAALAREFTHREARVLLLCVFLTIVLQLIILSLGVGREVDGGGTRAIAFFTNPNQLSYFATLCAGAALLLAHLYRFSSPLVPLTVLCAVPVSAFSLSRGGTLACLLYVVLMLLFSNALSTLMRIVLLAALVAGVGFGAERFMASSTYEGFGSRLEEGNIERESEHARGYNRIFDYPDNLVWGAGEGYDERFEEDIELHSYPGTVLFCYGLIGLLLMGRFLVAAVPDVRTALYLVPILVYNLTHHGGRSLILWAILGIVAAVAAQREGAGARRRSRGRGSRSRSSSRRRVGGATAS